MNEPWQRQQLSLWPVRPKPQPDELLSSWLVRVAHGHGLKVQTFCNLIFDAKFQVWNRDIDRLAPERLIEELILRTGVDRESVRATTLKRFEGVLYEHVKVSGLLPWVLNLNLYHRTFQGHGIQFCSRCLSEDQTPHFRLMWRVSFNTVCWKHGCLLQDRCWRCNAGVAFHRREMGRGTEGIGESLSKCSTCGAELIEAPVVPAVGYSVEATEWLRALCAETAGGGRPDRQVFTGKLAVMRQMVKLLTSTSTKVQFHTHVCSELGIQVMRLKTKTQLVLEGRSHAERHHITQLAAWIMTDLEEHLESAWRSRALHFNRMLKEFDEAPGWYREMVGRFSSWRGRLSSGCSR